MRRIHNFDGLTPPLPNKPKGLLRPRYEATVARLEVAVQLSGVFQSEKVPPALNVTVRVEILQPNVSSVDAVER